MKKKLTTGCLCLLFLQLQAQSKFNFPTVLFGKSQILTPAYKPAPQALPEEIFTMKERFAFALHADSIITFARKFIGIPYRYAGHSAYGFDCSGFTSFVLSKFGYQVSRSAVMQAIQGKSIESSQARKGDLIFFRGSNGRNPSVGHVGMIVSEAGEKIRFIHSSCDQGINVESIEASYYKARFIKICRVIDK
jgi:cell wall-associated NlpC family hydrolase